MNVTGNPLRLGVALASMTLLLAACGGGPDKGNETDSDSLPYQIALAADTSPDAHFNWAMNWAPTSWDPTKSQSGADLYFYYPVYDRLFELAPDATLEPMLATGYEVSADGKSATLTLRKDVAFSDGTELDAEAVKFNLDRSRQAKAISAELSQIETVEVVDEHTVVITVEYGLGALLVSLSARGGIIVSPQAAQAGALEQGPVGIGPYATTSIVTGDRVEYAKTPNYWDSEAQKVATMTYRSISDDQTRLNALQSGEVDGAVIEPSQIVSAQAMDLNVLSKPSVAFTSLMVNSAKEPFDDPKVREALNYAIDREAISTGLYDGHCTPTVQPWPDTSPGYNDDIGDGLDIFPYDPEKAKELLKEAGVPEGLSVTLEAPNVTQYVKLAEVFQSELKEIGIDVTVKPVPSTVPDFAIDKVVEMQVNPYTGIADPHGVFARTYLPGALYNVGLPMDQSTLDKAMAAAGPVDPAERKELYKGVMQDMIDTPPHMVPVCLMHLSSAYNDKVSNVEQPYSGQPTYRGVAMSS